ncbi:unnamed protein product, partial [Ectocarpus sp. 13 AM-2016]
HPHNPHAVAVFRNQDNRSDARIVIRDWYPTRIGIFSCPDLKSTWRGSSGTCSHRREEEALSPDLTALNGGAY